MGKVYTFKRLTNQVKHFAVLMLITLMAVGNLFAEQVTFVFSEQGYSDAQTVESADFNDVISFIAAKNSSNTPPKYYNNGTSLRLYGQNSFTLTPAAGYVITGVSFTGPATGSNTPQLNYTVDNSELAADLPAVATDANKVYTISGIQAYQNVTVTNPNSSGHARIIAITVTYEPAIVSGVAMPMVTPVSGTYYTPQQVQLSCETPGANIYYSINNNEPVLYAGPFTVNSNTTLTAFATLGEETSTSVTVNYVFPIQVNNIAEFYEGEQDVLYQITGDVRFVWRNGQNIYVEDETGALLIFDNPNPIITTTYQEGDVISGGIFGTFTLYNGLVEMKPVLNTPVGVPGPAIVPLESSIDDILEGNMSKLVIIKGGEFTQSVNFTNGTAKNVNYTQGENTVQVRSQFRNITMDIATGTAATVMGFVGKYNNTIQIFPRFNDDIICHSVPTASNFEGASTYDWTIVNGDNTNKWYIGQAVGFDNNKLYISSSNGLTNKYNVSAASDVHAYFEVTLPNSDVMLTFDCRTVGDENDYLQVSVMDEAPEAGVLPTEVLAVFHNVNEFTNKSVLIPASYAGQKYIVFTWHNDNANGAQAPAAVDNVMMVSTCTTPTNVEVTVNDQTATVS